MAKQVTLLNFFQKVASPQVQKQNSEDTKNVGHLKSPNNRFQRVDYKVCELVWAKLEGYPWWPSLICQDPKKKKHTKGSEVHVQFFDFPPTRAWISKKLIEKYTLNSDKRNPKVSNETELKNFKAACEEADRVYKCDIEERTKFLFNFNDPQEEEESPGNNKENIESDDEEIVKQKKKTLDVASDDEEVSKKKKKKLDFDSDDSGDDYKPDKEDSEDDDETSGDDSNLSEIVEEEEEEVDLEDSPPKRVKRKRKFSVNSSNKKLCPTPTTPSGSGTPRRTSTKAKLALFKNQSSATTKVKLEDEKKEGWPHLKLDFLQPDKIMDKNKRRPDDPHYDKRTLFVPEDFKANVTPALRQWWDLKSEHFDCILFFKVGKFYELYHMDAVIGVNELSLTFMKGDFAHSGFPEISYGRFSTILVQKGYKVVRIEQTETPEMMTERCKKQSKTTKFDKVVSREICQITTKGTQIFSFIDGEAKECETNYLLALAEKCDNLDRTSFGVCFIDTSIGTFHIGQFYDDKYLSRLHILLSHHPPVQILYEKNQLSGKVMQLLKCSLSTVLQDPLATDTEFWSASKTLSTLAEENHFTQPNQNGTIWPEAIKRYLNPADSLGLSASDDGELAIKSLGACVWYLKQCFLDQQLLAMKKFEIYSPVNILPDGNINEATASKIDLGRYMIVDGLTLGNLEVLNNSNGGKSGTLLEKLDHCCTFIGKRLLRQWLCTPLCSVSSIVSRQEAIAELLENPTVVQEVRMILKKVPDMERLLGKIHTQGNAVRSKTHPDSRAIFFEDKVYSKRKIQDFLSALSGFEKLQSSIEILQKEREWKSKLLRQCILFQPEGKFRNLREELEFFKNAFDHELAKKEGCIIPKSSGVDSEYDAVVEELKEISKESNSYLKLQCQYFGATVKYFGSDKNRYQLEVPESQAKKADSNYEFTSCRKGFKRFVTSQTKSFLFRQKRAEEMKANILRDLSRRVFEQFSDKYEGWISAIQCVSVLDVLMSFTEYCKSEVAETCWPDFVEPESGVSPFINIRNGRHPCLSVDNGFISNDINLGTDDFNNLVLLTGPNMGGKSTLMRQLGLITILAQVGLKVPAESCKLLPVDRIFTRIGAKDDILAGESTFYVELSEASLILNSASKYSLVLIDELGRGTSTYDGTAIAYSVVKELSNRRCRTMFSTHYHILLEDFKNSDAVTLGHMACMVETDEDDPSEETVTFLYKFILGACPKSYGFNAAKLAGLPNQIVKAAREKTLILEKEAEKRKVFKKICGSDEFTSVELTNLLKTVQLV
ncbi:hypothetical protein RUM43_013752 [Polyplax serrata]|uniref:DNA mismatch repair protein n=1 Tax=Polyplax serrata TaxID=468196 RepID=A0AAN8Q2C3_POLSC